MYVRISMSLWESLRHIETLLTLWDPFNTLRCFETLWDALRHFETLWDSSLWRFEMLWDALRRFETLWGAFETLWDPLRCFETLWDPLRCFETLLDPLRPFEMLLDPLRPFETLWELWNNHDENMKKMMKFFNTIVTFNFHDEKTKRHLIFSSWMLLWTLVMRQWDEKKLLWPRSKRSRGQKTWTCYRTLKIGWVLSTQKYLEEAVFKTQRSSKP